MDAKRFIGRIIVAALIALFGWYMYMSRVEENPITGKKQHVAITPDQEVRLGLESAPVMSREMGGEIPSTDPRTQVVQRLGNMLAQDPLVRKSPWQFQFHLLADEETVNAFALPGGQIFITLALLNKLNNEAELAGVLGHEMGHVFERHTAEQMAKTQLGQTMVVAVGAAASDHAQGATMMAALVNQMMQLRYGRQDEVEADEWGIRILEQAHYDPRAMVRVMEVLKAASRGGDSGMDIFKTHPNPNERIKDIEAYLAKHPAPARINTGYLLQDLYKNPALIGKSQPEEP